MIVISWFIPAILLFYYWDTNRRAQETFTSGLRYAAELSSERLNKAFERAGAMEADAVGALEERPEAFVFVATELTGEGVYDFGNGGDYSVYKERDRELLMNAMDSAGSKPILFVSPEGRFYAARWLFADYEVLKRRAGVLVIMLDREYVFSYLSENVFGAKSLEVDINGVALVFEKAGGAKLAISGAGAANDSHMAGVSGAVGAGQLVMRYHGVIDKSGLFGDYLVMSVIFYSLFFICPLLLFVSLMIYRSVSKPVTSLMEAINALNRGNYGVRIDEGSGDEFTQLAHAFNNMSSSLSESLRREQEKDAASRESRLLALRAQINPHFINNTLEFINWKSRMNDADGVSGMVEALSTLLEAAMGREGDSLLPLTKELSYARAYLSVIKMRFGDRVTVRTDIDDDALGCLVPPLILQPLLENAVVHGIEPKSEGSMDLKASYGQGKLTIRVENDGALSDNQKERIAASFAKDSGTRRLGVRNVAERLNLLFGGAAKFEVFGEGGRTVAEVVLPFEKVGEGEEDDGFDEGEIEGGEG